MSIPIEPARPLILLQRYNFFLKYNDFEELKLTALLFFNTSLFLSSILSASNLL